MRACFPIKVLRAILYAICALGFFSAPALAQIDTSTIPFVEYRQHNVGKRLVYVSNTATIQYPWLRGGLWIGGVVGRDTLVSVAHDGWRFSRSEFQPGTFTSQKLFNELTRELNAFDTLSPDAAEAKSEQDFIMVYYDTLRIDDFSEFDLRPHKPLNLRIRQSSYAWGVPYADDLVLVDYLITNTGRQSIEAMYLGMFLDGDEQPEMVYGFLEETEGFSPRKISCSFTDLVDIAWIADVNGLTINPETLELDTITNRGASGFRVLRPTGTVPSPSFNWWMSNDDRKFDFGPRKFQTSGQPFRDFGGFLGTPEGDRNKYYQLSNREIDYDQITTAVDHVSEGWLPPPVNAIDISNGIFDNHWLVSVGPVDLKPGESVPFSIALFTADNIHPDLNNFAENFDPLAPDEYYNNLDFSELVESATWAKWVYDNPGFDTDGNGYRGLFQICINDQRERIDTTFVIDTIGANIDTQLIVDTSLVVVDADTIWISGDGEPDFRGVSPPPAPEISYTSEIGKIILEWNGKASETTPDIFLQEIDFEGYHVYLGLVKRRKDLALIASYDIEDYAVWYYDPFVIGIDRHGQEKFVGGWRLSDILLLTEIQEFYADGDPNYDPVYNDVSNPLVIRDSVIYFSPQEWNVDELSDTTSIHKIYPSAPYPHTLAEANAFTEDTWYENPQTGEMIFYEGGELTPDGKRFKYFEYRFIIDNLLPSQVYYLSVTAFDHGSPTAQIPWLESNRVGHAVEALAQASVEQISSAPLDVAVYPNPYRKDGNYRALGFEGRGREDLPADRLREIHFTNLPPVCDVSIYSLDGDLLWTIEHRKAPDDPSAMHDSWNVLSRNLLPIASGIYYWVVETPEGRSQIGKLVIIM